MEPQKVLDSLAREKGVPLTSLAEIIARFSQSGKVACCGGLMTRLVTESAADSTVLLRDGTGSCYCALHGDITNRYPDVLTTGALLLFTDVTVLVLSSKVPPLLIACLQNLSGLLLPDEASSAAAAAMDAEDSVPLHAAAAMNATAQLFPADTRESETVEGGELLERGNSSPFAASQTVGVLGGTQTEASALLASAPALLTSASLSVVAATAAAVAADAVPPSKRTRVETSVADCNNAVQAASLVRGDAGNDDDDEDADCLELVDDI